jgi:cobalt-precorrin 5A hydrolase/precorrin-3B C17-methyltransferase
VALVCSGDPGIYAMASIAIERAAEVADPAAVPGNAAGPATGTPAFDVEVLPGVSAGQAAAALLGAPLGHDHAVISLSDLLTPWAAIEARLAAAGSADLAVVLYNPRSRSRTWQLPAALQVLGRYRPPTTPVGLVTDAHRPGEQVRTATLADLDPAEVGMTTCVIVGSGTTRAVGDHLVTPRGYRR